MSTSQSKITTSGIHLARRISMNSRNDLGTQPQNGESVADVNYKAGFTWKVQFSSIFNSRTNHNPLVSPLFKPSKDSIWSFSLYLFPNGLNEEFSGFVSLGFQFHDCEFRELKANYALCIIDCNGDKCNEKSSKPDEIIKIGSLVAFGDFISRDFLRNNGNGLISLDSTITIFFEIDLKNVMVNYNFMAESTSSLSRMQRDFGKLFNNRQYSDAIILIKQEPWIIFTIHVHKAILAARSATFARMFENEQSSNATLIEIEDFNREVMTEVLRYIYTGKVNNLETMAVELLKAAVKYELEELKSISENFLRENLNLQNVVNILKEAHCLESAKLKNDAVNYMVLNGKKLQVILH